MANVSKINKIISEKLCEYGYSQRKLAFMMGYAHQASICQKISGKRNWTLEDVLMLSKIFNFERFDELF